MTVSFWITLSLWITLSVCEAMGSQLSDVVGIFDMDGFLINKKFLCKELGIIRVGDVAARSYFFDLGIRWSDLCAKDRKSCAFVMKHIHKLPFGVPSGVSALPLGTLEDIVVKLYQETMQNEKSIIAYKGGCFEKDLLASLGIPSVNLERFGCPKASSIIKTMVWLETCGQHLVPDAFKHCPKVEVEAYAQWLGNVI